MGLQHAIRALAEHWESVDHELSTEDSQRLDSLVSEFAREADPRRLTALARRIAGFLGDVLRDDHPVLLALESWETRWQAPSDRAPQQLAEWLALPHALGS